MEQERVPHVVIIGSGFGGLYAARALERSKQLRLTVIDKRNHHLFQPLLYQVASAALNPGDIAAPIRGVLEHNVEVLLGEAKAIDAERKEVVLTDGRVPYDYLIVATGATHSYFGKDDWAKYAPGLKTLEDALDIRRRVLLAFEAAEREPDPRIQAELLTFVIVGAGPTGVEMAGALAEISRETLARDFRHIDPRTARIVLLEGVSKVLPTYPDNLSAAARKSLERLGVEVRTDAKVTQVDAQGVVVDGKERIAARTVIWAAGVAASPLAKTLGVPLDRAGRVQVTKHLTVPGHDDIFVIGDLAHVEGEDGKPVPGVAPAAMQMGKSAAKNIVHQLRGEPMRPFSYWDRGTFSVIGRGHAVGVAFRSIKMKGVIAWLAWLFIHVLFLVGFRNRIAVLFNWAYSYLAYRRAVRIITGDAPVRAIAQNVEGAWRGGVREEERHDRQPPVVH